jgi:UDP-GlcNAc3NAcA epimerase
LAAAKLGVPVAHVEAGLRSFDNHMPEELNRLLTDNLSDVLFCPTDQAVRNLHDEGFGRRAVDIQLVGDVMLDAAYAFGLRALPPEGLRTERDFVVATVHRAENTDDDRRLGGIVSALNQIHENVVPVVFPVHPRTRQAIQRAGVALKVDAIEPVGYLQMLWLLQHSLAVLTDSGGLQKEAFFHGKPCVILRDRTEWVELVELGASIMADADLSKIVAATRNSLGRKVVAVDAHYGGGRASSLIAGHLSST